MLLLSYKPGNFRDFREICNLVCITGNPTSFSFNLSVMIQTKPTLISSFYRVFIYVSM